MRVRGLAVVTAAFVVAAGAGGCGGSSGSSSSSTASQKTVTFDAMLACLNKAFHSGNVESDVGPVNPPQLLQLYAAVKQHDVAVTLSNGGTGYVFVFPSAAKAAAGAKASPVSDQLAVRANIVTAYVHAPPPAGAPPAKQRAPLALIVPPGPDGTLVQNCA